jgi:hypothetical protein
MNSQKFALSQLVALASLLLCCPTAWCQRFETSIYGNEVTCNQINRYNLAGQGDLKDKTEDTCASDGSTASASSSASLDLGINASASIQKNGAANSLGRAIQTATLKPPKGFRGMNVTFSYADPYATKLSGSGDIGVVEVCWLIAQLNFKSCQALTSNGEVGGTMHQQFVLKKSSAGFRLTIAKEVLTSVSSGGGSGQAGAVTTSYPTITLPRGWTCKYDSGSKCP